MTNTNLILILVSNDDSSTQRGNMSKSVCRFNKFGYCKFGNRCFRKHENEIYENAKCNSKECSLRHPKNCKYFLDFQYCKFGAYCKFSHPTPITKATSKEIDDLKEKLKLLKKEIDAKDKLIKEKNNEMEVLKKEHESETKKQESEYFKEIEGIRNDLHVTQMLFDAFKEDMTYKYGYDSSAQTSDEELDEIEISNVENNECNICDFKGKTTGGLKTHIRRKHGDGQKSG